MDFSFQQFLPEVSSWALHLLDSEGCASRQYFVAHYWNFWVTEDACFPRLSLTVTTV